MSTQATRWAAPTETAAAEDRWIGSLMSLARMVDAPAAKIHVADRP